MSIFSDKHLLIYDDCEYTGRSLHNILSAFEIGQLTVCHDWKDAEYCIKNIKYDYPTDKILFHYYFTIGFL